MLSVSEESQRTANGRPEMPSCFAALTMTPSLCRSTEERGISSIGQGNARPRSAAITPAALRPEAMETPGPGWVPESQR